MPGLAPSTPAFQRALGARDVAVRVELGGVLAEVPDVALACPGVYQSVVRSARRPLQVEPVLDDDAGDAVDRLRPVGDGHDVA